MIRTLTFTLLFIPMSIFANCSLEQSFCETQCKVKHFSDEAAELGCVSACVAKRAVCSTEAGTEEALQTGEKMINSGVEIGKEAWEDTRSFIKGATE